VRCVATRLYRARRIFITFDLEDTGTFAGKYQQAVQLYLAYGTMRYRAPHSIREQMKREH
jgi:hypothetical protein